MTGSIAQGADARTPTLSTVSWRAAPPGVRVNRHDLGRWVGPPELLAFKLWLFRKMLLHTGFFFSLQFLPVSRLLLPCPQGLTHGFNSSGWSSVD